MVNPDRRSVGAPTLRSLAEEKAQQDAAAQGRLEPLSPEANLLLLHELRVHQIELEMQNEELRRAQAELDATRARYFDLYDLAPVGYCTLSKEGLILEANLTATTLLGLPRSAMVKQPISRFIHPEDMDLFYLHRQRLLDAGDSLAWDMRMVKKDGTAFWGHLEAGVAQDLEGEDVIRLLLSNVTERVWAARAQAFLAKAAWLTSGEGFFPALARFLADDLGMDYVCIDRLAGDGLEAETLAIWCDGHFEENVSYALKDTPCGDVVGKTICCFPSGVRHLFPKDQVLQGMKAESYLGVTLWGAKGQPIGLIALIGRHPMADTDLAKTTLDLVSLRAAAELEHHQAEEALQDSNDLLSLLVQHSPIYAYIKEVDSKQSRVLMASDNFQKMVGIQASAMIGKTMEELYPAEMAASINADDWAVVSSGKGLELSEEFKGRCYSTFKFPIVQGTRTLLAGFTIDITERKNVEELLREVMQNSQSASYKRTIQDNVYAYLSPVFSRITGYPIDEFISLPLDAVLNLIHPEDLPDLERGMAAAISGLPGSLHQVEYRFKHLKGHYLWLQDNFTVLHDANAQPLAIIGSVSDISERKQAEQENAKFQAQLQQTQKMESLGTLAGGVAHDMNNVLGAILGLASAHIGSQPYGSPLHQALDTICKATERGGKMVKTLLGFARQSPAENNRLDMNAILREQVGFLERTTLAKVQLKMDLQADLRPIQGDASALTHAFMNLCVNAVDAMPENGTLTLHTRNVDNDWIEIEVEDDGMGMSKEVLEKAIDPFFTTKSVGKGTGLGLSMVFSTMKAHRGQMAIESEPGQGTRVRLRFPACMNEIQVAVVAAADATMSHHRTLNVLLVDDDDLIQSSVQAILEVLGHTAVNTALSGEEALALLEAGLEPDLVILDMNMPGLGGFGTLPRLRGLRPAVPVLLSTGRADETALALADGYPGVTLLSKPFGLRELQKHLENIGLG